MGIFSERENNRKADLHLRRARQILGIPIYARHTFLGRVSDFLIETESSIIRYFVLRKAKLLSFRHFLISPEWIDSISYLEQKATLNIEPSLFATSPSYRPGMALDRSTEARIFSHHGRLGYWESRKKRAVNAI